jgi:ATP-dependent DNA helicase RecQ
VSDAAEALKSERDRALYSALRKLRLEIAKEAGKPAYTVFPDRTLIELALTKPATLGAMSECHGVGARKLERYGEVFFKVIADYG